MRYTSSFLEALSAEPSRRVLDDGGAPVTAGDVLRYASQIAAMLENEGFDEHRVAVALVEPGPAFLAIVYATMISGMKLALIDPEMGPDNFRAKLAQLKPAVAFVDSRILLLQEHPLLYGPARKWFQAPFVPSMPEALVVAVGPWLPIVRRHVRFRRWLKHGSAIAGVNAGLPKRTGEYVITYTSGTLAEPKGVVHSLDSLDASIRQVAAVLGDRRGQRIATHLPHYVLLGISAGIPVLLWKRSWPAERKIRFLREKGVTSLFGPPSEFLPMIGALERAKERFPSSLILIMLGSAPVYPSLLRRLKALVSAETRVVCMYGMTENLLAATASMDEKLAFQEHGDLVGRPVEGVEVAVAEDGELLIRSAQCFERYFHETGRPDWHRTGDLARIRADGGIVLQGRKKDMIIRGDFNLYPALYESTVCRIDGVEAAVFLGVYDEARADEVVHLVVEPTDNSASSAEVLRRRIANALREGDYAIDRQAIPDQIWLMKLPRSGRSQKVDRQMLRTQLRQLA
jgi:acyl-CoA synthetase (AMP-forming)/AMP-acid ligase II